MSNPKITRQEAIKRLSKARPVFARFRDGSTHIVRSIADDEVFIVTHASPSSTRPLADVAFFSPIDNSPVKSSIDIDDQFDDKDVVFSGSEDSKDDEFDDEDLETTIL